MTLLQVYQTLYQHYGPQSWWPADSPFEVMVGAILTQNTAWNNVEKAITLLRSNHALSAQSILNTPTSELAEWIRPSGYFNIKSERIKNFCAWFLEHGGLSALKKLDTDALRHALLAVKGIGPETADDMLLYAFQRPVFVIDAYTRRIFSRLQMINGEEGYEGLRHYFEQGLADYQDKVSLFNEYHALIVIHAKMHCSKRPSCDSCPLESMCDFQRSTT